MLHRLVRKNIGGGRHGKEDGVRPRGAAGHVIVFGMANVFFGERVKFFEFEEINPRQRMVEPERLSVK